MGMSTACAYATISFGSHEHLTLLPNFQHNLLYYKRYIDDIFAIWVDLPAHENQWSRFNDIPNDLGTLKWKTETPSNIVTFLDLQLKLDNGKIMTSTYQTPMNLYQYIPPLSSHPPSCLKGLIISTILRYCE